MTRSRLFSLAVTTLVALGIGVGTAAASVAAPAGSVVVHSRPPVCC